MYAPITLPVVDTLLMEQLRPALPGVGVGTLVPGDITDRLPYVVARTHGGDSRNPRFVFRATVQVDAYAAGRPDAGALAEQARLALHMAWLNQTVTTSGSFARFDVTSWPSEYRDPDAPSGMSRFTGTYALTVRPARPTT